MQNTTKHPFQHLGNAPYRFIDVWSMPSRSLQEANPTAYNNAFLDAPKVEGGLGTCACCGMGIMNIYVIETAEGKRFGVGSECVLKTNREPKIVSEVKEAKKRLNAAKRHERENRKNMELAAMLEDESIRNALSANPHPLKWKREQGETMLEWAEWMFRNAGNAGKGDVYKAIKKL